MKAWFLLGLTLWSVEVLAYIPPASFIFERMMKAREGLKTLELIADVQDLTRQSTFRETLKLDFLTGRYGLQISEPEGAVAFSKTAMIQQLEGLARAWIVLGYDPSDSRARETLGKVAPFGETKLIRTEGKIRWSWGDPSRGSGRVLVEKDKFVWAGTSLDSDLEVVVQDQARFPRVILVKKGGSNRYVYTLRQFKINTPMKWATSSSIEPQGVLLDSVQDWVEVAR